MLVAWAWWVLFVWCFAFDRCCVYCRRLPGLLLVEFACYLVVLLPVIIVVIWHDCDDSSLWWFDVVCGGLCVCFRLCLVYGLVSVLIVDCLLWC